MAYSILIDAPEQHVRRWMCAHSAKFLNFSPFCGGNTGGRGILVCSLGAPNKEKNSGKETGVKVFSAPAPGQQLLSGVCILQGLEKLEQLKTKAFYPSIAFPGLAGLQLVMCYLFLVLIAGGPRNISVIYSAGSAGVIKRRGPRGR